jgi:hypothetical protein
MNENDIFYFQNIPTDLYCQMRNPSREVEIAAIFGFTRFKDVLKRYILTLSQKKLN